MISTILFYFALAVVGALIYPTAAPRFAEAVWWITFLLVSGVFWFRWFRKNRID